jgi:hypothetical protein
LHDLIKTTKNGYDLGCLMIAAVPTFHPVVATSEGVPVAPIPDLRVERPTGFLDGMTNPVGDTSVSVAGMWSALLERIRGAEQAAGAFVDENKDFLKRAVPGGAPTPEEIAGVIAQMAPGASLAYVSVSASYTGFYDYSCNCYRNVQLYGHGEHGGVLPGYGYVDNGAGDTDDCRFGYLDRCTTLARTYHDTHRCSDRFAHGYTVSGGDSVAGSAYSPC